MKLRKKGLSKFISLGIILLSFLVIIFIGGLLLALPISHNNGNVSFIDALMISTSAVSVTGLTPISDIAGTFNIFGKIVIAILIEIGGLGLVSLVMFIAVILGFKISFGQRLIIKEALNQDAIGGIVQLLKKIVITAVLIQSFGAFFIFIDLYFIHHFPFIDSIGYSIFHAISSFNNAGFDIFGSTSLSAFRGDYLFNISTMLMIIFGGIGFIVIFDIIQKRSLKKLSLHSKIVLSMTAFLLFFGTIMIKILNWSNISWLDAAFLSVSSRTAGFYNFDLQTLSYSSILIIILLMFIGAAPASTGGGIKVTTFFTMITSFKMFAIGENDNHAFKRKIPPQQIVRAFILSIFAIFITIFISFFIFVFEGSSFPFDQVLFESFSAFATVGLSLGITPQLTIGSKIMLCLLMYIGRLGPITFISLFNRNNSPVSKDSVQYVEENIIIG